MPIGFVNDLIDKQGGAINEVAGKMSVLRKKTRQLESVIGKADKTLGSMDTVLPPNLPSPQDMTDKLNDIDSKVRGVSADIADISGIGGSCLSGAMGSLNSIKKDAFSVVREGINSLNELSGIPSDFLSLTESFSEMKDMINTLGITDLVGDISEKMGCLSDSSLLDEIDSEINSITSQFGLSPSGEQDPSLYKQMISDKLSSVPGLDPSYKTFLEDGMSSASEKAGELGDAVKKNMKDSITSIKKSVPKLPATPKFF